MVHCRLASPSVTKSSWQFWGNPSGGGIFSSIFEDEMLIRTSLTHLLQITWQRSPQFRRVFQDDPWGMNWLPYGGGSGPAMLTEAGWRLEKLVAICTVLRLSDDEWGVCPVMSLALWHRCSPVWALPQTRLNSWDRSSRNFLPLMQYR